MIRDAAAADLTLLGDIEQASFGDSWSIALLAAELTEATRDVLVDDAGRGYATVATVGDTADLMRIAVVPDARRSGLGRELMAAALDRARAAGAERILLEVAEDNEPALAFYRALDWREIGRREGYYPGGTDALVFEFDLRG